MAGKHEVEVLYIVSGIVLISILISPILSSPQVTVYLDPSSINVKPGDYFTIMVKVDPNGYGISGGEINLAFDPDAFSITDVSAGDILGSNPLIGVKDIRNDVGTLKYALARVGSTPVPTSPGSFAIVKFKALTEASSGSYQILLTHVGLADQNFEDIPPSEISLGNSSVSIATVPPTTTVTETVFVTTTVSTLTAVTLTVTHPPVTTTTSTTTQIATETVPTTLTETLTSTITRVETTTLPASTVTVETLSPSYVGGGLVLGIIIGIVATYLTLRRR